MYSKEFYMSKMENREINIIEILKYILRQWKRVVIFAIVIFALMLLMKVYVYQTNETKQVPLTNAQLGNASMQKVEDIIKLKEEVRELEEYKKKSVYMKIDPMNTNVTALQYFVNASNKSSADIVSDLYTHFILYGSFKEELEKGIGTKINDYTNLVSVVKTDDVLQKETVENAVLTLQIVTPDENMGRAIAEVLKDSLKKYQVNTVNKLVGKHEFNLISESNYTEINENIRVNQDNFEIKINEKNSQIASMEDQLTNMEKAALQQKETGAKQEVVSAKTPKMLSFKFLVLAASVSILCVIGVYSVYYLINNKLKSSKEISEIFDIPYVEWNKRMIDSEKKEFFQKEIEFLCEAQDVKRVFVSCLDKSIDKTDLDDILSEVRGIEFAVGSDMERSKTELEIVKKCENMFLAVMPNRTSYANIVKLLNKCEYLGIKIIGAISVE